MNKKDYKTLIEAMTYTPLERWREIPAYRIWCERDSQGWRLHCPAHAEHLKRMGF